MAKNIKRELKKLNFDKLLLSTTLIKIKGLKKKYNVKNSLRLKKL